MAADTFVVSIYRRSSTSGKEITGLAERTVSGERKAFSSIEELWAFLSDKTAPSPTRPRKKQKSQKQP